MPEIGWISPIWQPPFTKSAAAGIIAGWDTKKKIHSLMEMNSMIMLTMEKG